MLRSVARALLLLALYFRTPVDADETARSRTESADERPLRPSGGRT